MLAAGFAGDTYEREHRSHLEERVLELAGGPALTSVALTSAIEDLRAKHDEVTQLAHDSVAHRSLRPKNDGVTVTYEEIIKLLEETG